MRVSVLRGILDMCRYWLFCGFAALSSICINNLSVAEEVFGCDFKKLINQRLKGETVDRSSPSAKGLSFVQII